MVRSRGSRAAEGAGEAEAAVIGTSVQLYASAACADMALRRVALDGGAPEGGTGGARRGSLLVDGGLEDKRMFLKDAGLLADPLRSPPSAEACAGAGAVWGQTG